ncbi:MAG: MBL fold metallo-hydrolase [Bdellovibrionota bacterium]
MQDPAYPSPKWWPRVPRTKPPKPIRGTILTVLGCGTSTGVPLLACRCATCRSKDPRNNRSRASVFVQAKGSTFLIDTSPDLRLQCMRNKIFWVDAALFTHPHADHIHGLDDLRSLNFLMAKRIPCYGNSWLIESLQNKFDYIFKKTQIGGGKPMLDLHVLTRPKMIAGAKVIPLELIHGRMPVLGFRINDIAYITDCSYIPDRTFRYLKNLSVLVLDCLRPAQHETHLNVEASLAIAKRIAAKRTYLTHMGHELEYNAFKRSLPRGIVPAYDGLKIRA